MSGLFHHLFREDRWQTWPNAISAVRILLLPVFGILLVRDLLPAATITLALIFFTDFLDGFVARRTGTVSNLGTWLDPIADRLTGVVVTVALAIADIMPWPVVVALFVPDVVLGLVALVAFRGSPEVPVTWIGKIRTALLFVGITLVLIGIAWPSPSLGVFDAFVLGGEIVVLLGLVGHYIAGAQYLRAMLARRAPRIAS